MTNYQFFADTINHIIDCEEISVLCDARIKNNMHYNIAKFFLDILIILINDSLT